MNFTLRCLPVLAAVALCGACTTAVGPSSQQMQSLQTIDVVIVMPSRGFYFSPNDDESFVLPNAMAYAFGNAFGSAVTSGAATAGAALGPAFAVGLAGGLIRKGIDHAAAAPAREAAPIVAPTVDDIDMRRTTFAQLAALLPAERAATLRLSDAPWPEMLVGQTLEFSYARAAEKSSADATLYLLIAPLFRSSSSPDPHTIARALLYSRTGKPLLSQTVQFAGVKAPEGSAAAKARWWADGRYRRLLLQSVHGVLTPVAEALTASDAHLARAQRLQQQSHRLQSDGPDVIALRTSMCALDNPDKAVLRHQELWSHQLVLAICSHEQQPLAKQPEPRTLQQETLGRGGEAAPRPNEAPLEDVWFTTAPKPLLPPVIAASSDSRRKQITSQ